jgi:hypothetical protein
MADTSGFFEAAPGQEPASVKKKKGISLFGPKKQVEKGPSVSDILEQVNEMGVRLSIIEDRSSNLSGRMQVTDSSLLKLRKRIEDEIRMLNSEVVEIRRSITELTNKVDLIIKELKTRAGKEDIETIRKYVEMWEPLNFVTREEVEKLIIRMLGKEEEEES